MLIGSLLVLAGCGGSGGNDENAADRTGAENLNNVETRTDLEESGDTEMQTVSEESGDTETQTAPEESGNTETQADAGEADQNNGEDRTDMVPQTEDSTDETVTKLSILGDSISTFDGWIPEGYSCYFPMDGDVTEVEQTWWQMVLKDTDMELCVNGSSSGSTCAGDSTSADDCRYGCSDYRIGDLIGSNGCFPDVIIVYMGTNDVMKSVPLGDNDGTQAVEEGVIENFSDAYCLMLDKLIASYPNAEIYCCNLPPMGNWGPASGPTFKTFVNGLELTSEDYGERIEMIAAAKGCRIVDLQNCGITMENLEWYVSDGVHMNPEGMKLIRDAVEAAMSQK